MNPAFVQKLGLHIRKTNVGAQKIDGSALETFGMMIADFQMEDKGDRPRFFQETFLVANIKFEVVLEMPFLKISNADITFSEGMLTWKSYTTNKALPTTERVQLVNLKEFVIAVLDADSKTFVVYVAVWEQEEMAMDPNRKAQVKAQNKAQIQDKAQVGALLFDEALTEIPAEYFDYSDVFLAENAAELPENTGMNEHAIKLEEDKQPPFRPIYSLSSIELEILKTYIVTIMANGFICPSKSLAGAPILFDRKLDGSLRLCVNYRGLNNITIKNRYPLSLIGESLDWLSRAKRFIQLNFTNAYHRMRICEGDEQKTTFRTRYGYFGYQVILFGLSNAPATFQGYVNKILAEKLNIFVTVYLDDILIYTEDSGQPHIEAVCWVLNQLKKYSLFANLKKYCFHHDEVRFLKYVVSSKNISIEAEKIEVVREQSEPKSIRDIQVFLGFANFYRRFIQGFSKIAAPLTSMLKTTGSPDVSGPEVGNGDSEVIRFGVSGGGDELAKKSGKLSKGLKLSKSGNSKGKKSAKSKKPSKSGNSPNFDAKEAGPSFLTPEARSAFNRLRLAFTEAPIL